MSHLSERLERPLANQTVVVTRPREQSEALIEQLTQAGASVILLPAIEIRPPKDPGPLLRAIAQLETYDYLVFSSVNGVRFFVEYMGKEGRQVDQVRAVVCAIGPTTAAAAHEAGFQVSVLPEEYVAEALVQTLGSEAIKGKRVLWPRAAVARKDPVQELEQLGAIVDVVPAYETTRPETLTQEARRVFIENSLPDWVTFTSSSTVRNLLSACPKELLATVHIASIGPITSGTLREFGLEPTVEATEYTVAGLVEAMCRYMVKARAI